VLGVSIEIMALTLEEPVGLLMLEIHDFVGDSQGPTHLVLIFNFAK